MSFLSGGYYLVRPTSRAEHMNAVLLPKRILTVSDCIADLAPDLWATDRSKIALESRLESASKFGIDEAGLADIIQWTTAALENGTLGWTSVFFDLSTAHEFATRFLGQSPPYQVLDLALHRDHCPALMEEAAPEEGGAESGLYACISAAREPVAGGRAVGFDVLCLDWQSFHSYICNGLELEFDQKLGIKPNKLGFFDREADARKCAEYAGLDSTGAEPGLWQPWKVVLYDF